MFKYYNYTLIQSNRSYSSSKIQKLLGINPQTIRVWIKEEDLQCINKKPILIYGAILKKFIKERNKKHKNTLGFKEMKCLKCKNISIPKNNKISIYYNKNRSIRVVGICTNCDNECSKLYKNNSINQLKESFFIEPTESILYNTLPISTKTNLESQKEMDLNELNLSRKNDESQVQNSINNNRREKFKTRLKDHIKQQKFYFNYK